MMTPNDGETIIVELTRTEWRSILENLDHELELRWHAIENGSGGSVELHSIDFKITDNLRTQIEHGYSEIGESFKRSHELTVGVSASDRIEDLIHAAAIALGRLNMRVAGERLRTRGVAS